MNSHLTLWLTSHLAAGALLGGLLMICLLVWRGASAAQRCVVIGIFLLAMTLLAPLQGHWWPQIEVPVLKQAESVLETSAPLLTNPQPASMTKAASQSQTASLAETPKSHLPTILLTIWFSGAVLLLGRFAVGAWLWRRLWAEARRHKQTAEHELRVSERTAVPMASGRHILMPADWLKWSPEDQRAALEHELAHARHRDGLTRCLAAVATALHWPSPFVWLAERRLRLAQEQRCDETVLASGIDPAAYGRLLMRCAQKVRRSGSLWLSPAVASMARPSQLAERIEHIARHMPDPRPARLWHVVLPLLIVLAGTQALHVRLVAQDAASEAEGEQISIEVKFIESDTPLIQESLGDHQHVLKDAAALRQWLRDEKTKITSYPRMVTKINHKVQIRSVVKLQDAEAMLDEIGKPELDWAGTLLEVTPTQKAGKLVLNGGLGVSTVVETSKEGLPRHEGVHLRIDHATLDDGDTLLVGPVRRPVKKGESVPPMWLLMKAFKVGGAAELAAQIDRQRQQAPAATQYDFKDADAADVLRLLARDAKLERFLIGDTGKPQNITFSLKTPPLDALLHVCEKATLPLKWSGRYWTVGRPGAALPKTVRAEAAQKLRDSRAQEYEFSSVAAADILRFLATDAGISFISLPSDHPQGQKLLTFQVKDSPFGLLEALCGSLGIGLVRHGEVWHLSNRSTLPPMLDTPEVTRLRSAAARPYDFSRGRLGDVLHYIARESGIPLTLPPDLADTAQTLTFSIKASPFAVLETLCRAQGLKLTNSGDHWSLEK